MLTVQCAQNPVQLFSETMLVDKMCAGQDHLPSCVVQMFVMVIFFT